MAHIQTGNQMVTKITIIDAEPDKQSEALSLMPPNNLLTNRRRRLRAF